MGLISNMKRDISQAGGSRSKIFYVKSGSKRRVRFLTDAEDGLEVTFHDSFEQGINCMCLEEIGQDCPYCGDDTLRTRKMYVWAVWDYDSNEVRLMCYAANSFTPAPAIASMYENYGTLLDRDFVIERTGEKQNTSYTVIPMDKTRFRTSKESKVPSKKEMLKILAKAFPPDPDDVDSNDDDEEEKPRNKTKKVSTSKRKPEPEIEEDEETEDEIDYDDMSAQELYKLCKQRGIKCKPRKSEEYYIDLLEENDAQDEEEDDEWEEE